MPAPRRRQTPRRTIPEKWANLLEEKGFTDPRNGKASIRALADHTGIHPTTIGRMIFQESDTPSLNTVYALADAFKMSPIEIATFSGGTWEELPPWEPPKEARELSHHQRALVTDLIKELTRVNRVVEQKTTPTPQGEGD